MSLEYVDGRLAAYREYDPRQRSFMIRALRDRYGPGEAEFFACCRELHSLYRVLGGCLTPRQLQELGLVGASCFSIHAEPWWEDEDDESGTEEVHYGRAVHASGAVL